jgi:hypothetical protein
MDERDDRVLAMHVGGVRLGDRLIELRAQASNFYATPENEALAVTRILVDLGLDHAVANIMHRDRP